MLGQDLVRALSQDFGPQTLLLPTHSELDIADSDQVSRYFETHRPTLVINAAAYTNVDRAETDRVSAERANAVGPAVLARSSAQVGARLVHFSTDQVFDGNSSVPLTEEDECAPLNWYAESKLQGEKEVLRYDKGLVLRVQWLYGDAKDRFTPLRDKQVFTPFSDQYGAPTWTLHIADTVKQLVSKEASGLFHFAYDDAATWAEVYEFVREELKLSVELKPRPTSEVQLPAERPRYCVLSNEKLVKTLGVPGMGSWKEHLRLFLARKAGHA